MNFKYTTLLFCLIGGALSEGCWSESLGYACCKLRTTKVEFIDSKNNKYGIENGHFCGITDIQLCSNGDEYKCCTQCNVVYKDDYDWGVENNQWCSIPDSCYDEGKLTRRPISTTTTTTTRTTTTTTTTPKPSCGPSYSMCGGNLYPDAPNCCEDGNFCWKSHPDYYQCIPNYLKEIVDSYTTTQFFTSTKTKTSTATATPTNCSKGYFPCGGTNNPEASSCCEEGFYCHQHDVYYHQCLPYEDDSECASVYDVCGGSLFPDAPGCCEKGAKCVAYDESYSRCLPEDSTYTPPKCAKIGEPCGGTSYPNAPTCCENGGLCIAYNSSYSKCLENPDGFP